MDNYSSHLLRSGKGADSEYSTSPTLNDKGRSDENILLAGGFSTIHPDSSLPLSPTLQLNGDLTELNNTTMTALARAEFNRHNSQSFKSYTLNPDSRVTVIGTSSDSLHKFINTYGGVLQIEPILTKSYSPDLTTIQDLQLERKESDFFLKFTVKHPIDLSRCTYCGACGSACPEHCLSEQLFLDFSRCTFCKECVVACPHDAIDLYAVERRELTTPAILLLDETAIELPEQRKDIYFEKNLPALFESIYATEVEEIIGWDATLCQYSARLKTGCTACLTACHHGAVQQNLNGVQIDHLACVECGACLGSCPTGALQYKRFDDSAFIEYFRTFPLVPETTVVLGNEQELQKFWWYSPNTTYANVLFLEYPSVSALHTMHFLLLYAMGAKQILVLTDEDKLTESQIQLSNSLINELFKQKQAIHPISTTELDNALLKNEKRALFTQYYHDFSYSSRRTKTIDIIQFLRRQSETKQANIETTIFGEIICDETKCTQCIACVNECHMEALVADSDTFSLRHTPAQCVQCGICVNICPENALTMKPGLVLQDSFFAEKTISQAEPAKCKGCGKIFGTQKSLEKVMAILSSKNMWDSDDDLLSYCENCRVVNLYQSSEG